MPDRAPRRRWLALGVATALLLAACGGGGGTKTSSSSPTTAASGGKPWTVGFTTTQTGPIGPGYLATEYHGFLTYIDAVNKKGGILGNEVKVVGMDDRGDAAVAVSNFKELAAGESLAAMGSAFSTMAVAQEAFAAESKLPLIVGAAPDGLFNPPRPYFFSTNLPHAESAKIQVNFAKQLLKKAGSTTPKVAVMSSDSPGGTDFRKILETQFSTLGWKLVETQVHTPGTTDFAPFTAAVARANPEVVFALGTTPEIVAIGKGLRQRDMKAPIIVSYTASEESVFAQLGDDKFYAPRSHVWPTDPAAKQMSADAKAAGEADQMVSTFFTHGYVLGMLFEAALKKCGKDCTRETFCSALEGISSLDTKGLTGPAGFSATNHRLILSGKMFSWDPAAKATKAESDWITGEVK
jgi:branched-chain amino acid transport system substrate-binding protein